MSVEATDRTQTAGEMPQTPSAFDRVFLEHPRDVGETYFEHMGHSASYGWRVLNIAVCCFMHALVPSVHKTTASSRICKLADELDDRAQEAREERCRKSGSYDPGL
jgi:hypothetical protein